MKIVACLKFATTSSKYNTSKNIYVYIKGDIIQKAISLTKSKQLQTFKKCILARKNESVTIFAFCFCVYFCSVSWCAFISFGFGKMVKE